jgi:hypothetical protein
MTDLARAGVALRPTSEGVMTMAMRDPSKDGRNLSDAAFIVWTAILMVGLIILSLYAGGAPVIDAEQNLSIFAAP